MLNDCLISVELIGLLLCVIRLLLVWWVKVSWDRLVVVSGYSMLVIMVIISSIRKDWCSSLNMDVFWLECVL